MLWAQRFLQDGQRPLKERLRGVVVTLGAMEKCEIVENYGKISMFQTQRFLPYRQRPLKQRLRFLLEMPIANLFDFLL